MRPLHAVVMGATAPAVFAAGCGGAIPGSDGGPAALRLTGSKSGRFLVESQRHSLYLFEKDGHDESYCTGACAAVWPPLETSTAPRAGTGVQSGALGTTRRPDGRMQVTYQGHPLYYYAADASGRGSTKGQNVEQFGAGWYLVTAKGGPLESQDESNSNSGSDNGGGY